MLELLWPKTGDKVLDIGFGSGWTTALLAEIVGKKIKPCETPNRSAESRTGCGGKIFAIEMLPELCEFGEKNVRKYFTAGVRFLCINGSKGYPDEAPYDRILVSAAASKLPKKLKNQLKIKGRLVIPIQNSIWLIERTGENKFREEEHYGFSFVPLIN